MIRIGNFFRRLASCSKESVRIRRATVGDYDAVMSLRDPEKLFDGYDGLPDRYNMFLECSTNRGYVAMVNGEVAGFHLGIFVNGNNTVSLYGLRVAKEYEGLRITKRLVHNIFFDRESTLIQPTRWGTCMDTKTKQKHLTSVFLKTADVSIKMAIFPFISTTELLTTSWKTSNSRHLHEHDLKFIFTSDALCHNLFPNWRIMKSWNAYRPMLENIPLLMDSRTVIAGSNLEDANQALLSIGSYTHTFRGILYNLNVYGKLETCLEEHLLLHIKSLSFHSTSSITLEITVEDNIQYKHTKATAFMSEYGFQKPNYYGNYEVFCFEGNIKDLYLNASS